MWVSIPRNQSESSSSPPHSFFHGYVTEQGFCFLSTCSTTPSDHSRRDSQVPLAVSPFAIGSPYADWREGSGFVNFIRIGNRALNLDRVTHCEVQIWQDAISVKIYMAGTANNTPVVLNEEEAKEFWKYIEYVAEKPV